MPAAAHAILRQSRATVRDVARVAGVSPMTVSRAVNTPDKVPALTLSKVQAAIAETGYVPNLMAGGLRTNRSRLVAALIPTLVGPVFSKPVQALTAALTERGYQLMLGQTGHADSREDDWLAAVIGRRPDGIALTGVRHSSQTRRRLLASRIPVVETWDLTPRPIDMLVGFSHVAIARVVCRRLHAAGRRRLAVIGADDERARRRCDSFIAAALKLGLKKPLSHTVQAPTTLGAGRAGLKEFCRQTPASTASFAVRTCWRWES